MRTLMILAVAMAVLAVMAYNYLPFNGGQLSVTNHKTGRVTSMQVKQHYLTLAYAMYGDALQTAQQLNLAVGILINDPSDVTLKAARDAYKLTRLPYQQSEILRWDSDITQGKNLAADGGPASVDDWEGQVNAWPLDEGLIDYVQGDGAQGMNVIAAGEPINTVYLQSLNGLNDNEANVATGVHAIEFLLWGQDQNGTQAGAGQRPYTDFAQGDACTHPPCERRRTYLQQVTQLLVDDLAEMQAEWSLHAAQTGGTLAHNFLNSDDAVNYIVGSMRAMATDELASARMAAAFEHNDPEEEHDCFSDLSHVAIYYNFQGVKNAFYGRYTTVDGKMLQGASVADLIKQKDINSFNAFDRALASIENNMKQLLDAGERDNNPVRFDQWLAQAPATGERAIAEQTIAQLVGLTVTFNQLQRLSLK